MHFNEELYWKSIFRSELDLLNIPSILNSIFAVIIYQQVYFSFFNDGNVNLVIQIIHISAVLIYYSTIKFIETHEQTIFRIIFDSQFFYPCLNLANWFGNLMMICIVVYQLLSKPKKKTSIFLEPFHWFVQGKRFVNDDISLVFNCKIVFSDSRRVYN